jgi:C4-dicarboxylate transporter, DctM subunit
MSLTLMGVLVFIFLLIMISTGGPLAFGMGTVVVAAILIWFDPKLLYQLAEMAMDMGTSFLFLVAPLFIIMAELFVLSGRADDAFDAARKWFNKVPGGLAISSILACSAFAAVSGSSPLTASTIGLVAVPQMMKRGYSTKLAAGIVAVSGTIGIMIPPSLCMVIYGLLSGTSVGKLFIAGIIPGILLTVALSLAVIIHVMINPALAPRFEEKVTWKDRIISVKSVGPILVLCIAVIGSIYAGIVTPSEAAAVGASGAFIILLFSGKERLKQLVPTLKRSAGLTSAIMFLMIGGSLMGFLVTYMGIPQAMVESMLSLGLNRWWVMIFINLILLFLGCFLDPTAILALVVPLAFPIIVKLGFDPVWFGIVLTLNVEIGMVTPPVGLNLFVMKTVHPALDMDIVVKGALPYIVVLMSCLVILILFPQISLWLPNLMK